MEAAQGVTAVCLTPHLRADMFETPDEAIRRQYDRLRSFAEGVGLRLYLSREYHYDRLFRRRLREGELLPIGGSVLLVEFAYDHSAAQMLAAAEEVRGFGFIPLIAHVERYSAAAPSTVAALRAAGAMIQVNADAALGGEGRGARRLAWELLRAKLVDVVASDAHSVYERPPRMNACRALLTKKLGAEHARMLTQQNPAELLRSVHNGEQQNELK